MTPAPSSLADQPLRDIVQHDLRAASVFERFGLDYCCHGGQSLEDAARSRGVAASAVIAALAELGAPTPDSQIPEAWNDLSVLTRHIVDHHHRYLRGVIPTLNAQLDKLVNRHGERHAELVQIRLTFRQLADEVLTHLEKEENLLFPHIDEMAAAHRAGERLPPGPFATAAHPIRVMEADHSLVGSLLERLRELGGGFVAPEDGCTTYRACFAELAHFASDTHRHIYLENHVLFPRAIELERTLL